MADRQVKGAITLLLCMLLAAASVWAAEAPSVAEDAALEKRVQALTQELRCLVCQNQSLADSHADLAIDLKNQVRDKMKQGMTDGQIVEYMVARYGDFVLYRPPVKTTTLLLWFGPLLLLVVGIAVLFYRLSRRHVTVAPAELNESDRARVAALLGTNEAGEPR